MPQPTKRRSIVATALLLAAAAGTAVASDNLIGFNFTTSTAPNVPNWNRITGNSGMLTNAIDDTGAVTSAGMVWGSPDFPDFFSILGTSTLAADAVPQHTYDLSAMTGYAYRLSGEQVGVRITGLDPNTPYEYWFVSYRASLAIQQTVRVSDGNTIDAISFTQDLPGAANNHRFVVNTTNVDNTSVWEDLPFETTSSSDGSITFNWQASGSNASPAGAIAVRRAVPPEPFDVRILGTANPNSIGIGDNTTLTFDVVNPSPANVTGVAVDIELPAGLDYVSDDRGGTLTGNTLSANLGDLVTGDSTSINIVVNASSPGDFIVTGEVDINEVDPNLNNNTVLVPVGVGETDLGVAMSADANPVVIDSNGEVNFTIDYENFGPVNAADVQIVFTAPPELNITGTSAGVIDGSTVTVDLTSLSANNTGSFIVNTTATAANTNAVAGVEISHAGPDPDPANDSSEVSLLIVQSAADFPAIDTIFTNVHSLDNSIVPGRPGFRFDNNAAGTLTTAFMRPYPSPNGDLWILRAGVDAAAAQSQVIIVGAGTQGTAVLQRGDLDPAQPPFTFNAIGLIDEAVAINNSGSWVARTRNDDSPIEHFILKFDASTAEFSKPARTDGPVPGIAGAEYGTVLNSANITNSGDVSLIATGLRNVPTNENAAIIVAGQTVGQQGVSGPTGINLEPGTTWNLPTANTLEVSADGSDYIVRGTVNGNSGQNNVTAVNSEAVVQTGNFIPGDTVLNANAGIPHSQIMNADGDWMVRGQVSGGDRFVLFNGDIVAWTGGPTGLPDNSVWDNTGFAQNFFGVASFGDNFVIGGRTDNPDTSRRDVFVLVCGNGSVVEIMRAGDPVDLSGNGQFDDNAFIDRWDGQNDRVFMNSTHVYFVAQVRDTFEDNNNRFGQGFFRVELPDCGAPACPADLNGDGVVDADDFFLFLSLFAAGDPRADFNNDGVIDADDFFAYLSAFAAGC